MRRLPVYFLMDVSDSMVGEPIEAVQRGMGAIVEELRNDPYALETMYIGLIAFAGGAEVLVDLQELLDFQTPDLPIGSGTSLGTGLNLLMDRLEHDIQKTTANIKGDWKPIIFLFTDGAPTDNPDRAIRRWNNDFRRNANLVAVTFGNHADRAMLSRLTDNVLTLTETTPEAFREFFRWVSASLQVSSMSVNDTSQDGMRLADYCINLEKGPVKEKTDENFAILPLRCTRDGNLWLAKYQKNNGWEYIGSYPVNEEAYQRLGGAKNSQVGNMDLADVDRSPECPICGSANGVARCSCGGLSCISGTRNLRCPWCNAEFGEIKFVNNLEVSRSKG